MICIKFKGQIRFLHLLFLVFVIKVGKEITISFYIMTMRWLGSLGIALFYFIFYECCVWLASLDPFISISYKGFGNRKEFKVLHGNMLFHGMVVLFASVWLLVHSFFYGSHFYGFRVWMAIFDFEIWVFYSHFSNYSLIIKSSIFYQKRKKKKKKTSFVEKKWIISCNKVIISIGSCVAW